MTQLIRTFAGPSLWRPTPKRRALAQRLQPWLLRADQQAKQNVDRLLSRRPGRWIAMLAGMPSTRWLAILRPQGAPAQHILYGPSTAQAADLGRVLCEHEDNDWLQHRYCGPLNYTGQERLEQQSDALNRFLARCVEARREEQIAFAIHVAGDPWPQRHHSSDWDPLDAEQALQRACHRFDVYPRDRWDEDEETGE